MDWINDLDKIGIAAAIACGLILVGCLLYLALREQKNLLMSVCPNCGETGLPVRIVPGFLLMEFILLLCFVVPGVFYGLLRQIGTREVCSCCGAVNPVPLDSLRGRKLAREFEVQ